ncbi:MAG: hypothetical protein Q9188_004297 [Gyalolechia gomerana]
MRTYTSIFIPFLLTLLHNFPASTGATPQQSLRNTSIPTKLHVLGDPDPFLDDPCGPPEAPRAGRPGSKSTCGTVVADDLPAGSPFKLSCQMDNTGFIMNWDTCRSSVNAACAALTLATNPAVDRWVWAPPGTALEGDQPRPNCSVGFWNPSNGALLPDYERCKSDIFSRMIDGCATTAGTNVAAVNLAKLPRRTLTERFTGKAVSAGYPSEWFPFPPFFWLFAGEGGDIGGMALDGGIVDGANGIVVWAGYLMVPQNWEPGAET